VATESGIGTRTGRGTLIRWIGWFGIVNALLYALVGIRYLLIFGLPDDSIALTYMSLALVGQFVVLGYLPMMLVLAPVALLVPRSGLVTTLGVVLAAVGLSLVVLDSNAFSEHRFHLSVLTIQILDASTWVWTGVVFVVLLGFQLLLAQIIWKRVQERRNLFGVLLAGALILVWGGGQGIHIWADATAFSPVTSFTRYLPFYFPLKAKRRLAALGWVDQAEVEKRRLLRLASTPDQGRLQYPVNPLICDALPAQLPNILFLVVDALRPDKVSPEYTPRIHRFAKEGQQFTNHYSGGNSSRMGFFSMFYGIPSTYWQAFYDNQRPPVLLEEMLDRGYEISAISSVGFSSPAQIDRTVFAAIAADSLVIPQSYWSRNGDQNMETTQLWRKWFAGRENPGQPFFSFIYYDPSYFSVDTGPEIAAQGERVGSYERYMRRIAAVDREVDLVLQSLEENTAERDTIVIIASDHGFEFDELGLGNIGHASNYGPYQLKSVLLMDWPGRPPTVYNHRSAHQDLPATLLQNAFKCSNPADDYSSGTDLFSEHSWNWIMAGSYSSHAIVEPDKLVITYPGGFVELLDTEHRPVPGLELDPSRMREVMLEMSRFYR
jgi:hypothetical protein